MEEHAQPPWPGFPGLVQPFGGQLWERQVRLSWPSSPGPLWTRETQLWKKACSYSGRTVQGLLCSVKVSNGREGSRASLA